MRALVIYVNQVKIPPDELHGPLFTPLIFGLEN